MKIYIPFNSNDYNSIFTTLSIASRSYYPLRNYSFKRATPTVLNPLENYLIAFTQPVFSQKDHDKENGYVVNILIDYPEENLMTGNCRLEGVDCFLIDKTIYLHDNFKLIYRSKNEQNETEARALKSIETKFTEVARENSRIVNSAEVHFLPGELSYAGNPDMSANPTYNFQKERVFNKISGALLGFAVGCKSQLSPEINAIKNLLKETNNLSSLYFNKLGEADSRNTKERLLSSLDEIKASLNEQQSLEEALMVFPNSDFNPGLISTLKEKQFSKKSLFDWILEGFLNDKSNRISFPFHLIIEKAKRQINKKYSSKFPDSYIKNISMSLSEVKIEAEKLIKSDTSSNAVNQKDLLRYNDGKFIIPYSLGEQESEYFKVVLNYFLSNPNLSNPDQLHSNRKELLTELGITLKAEIPDFKNREERNFLLDLIKSLDSLRSSLDVNQAGSITFQSLAILFTSGRELQKYIDGVSALGVNSLAIPLSIWGAAFGYASLPKTLTSIFLDDKEQSKIFFNFFEEAERSFFMHNANEIFEEPKEEYGPSKNEIVTAVEEEKRMFLNDPKFSKYEGLKEKIVAFEDQSREFGYECSGDNLKKFLNRKENKIKGIGKVKLEEISLHYEKERLLNG